jgi:hypothetical protein
VITTWVAAVAATVRIEEPPAEIDAGLALIVTVGEGLEAVLTMTVAVAVTFPVDPVAVAVYVVLTVGFTLCVPPTAGIL